MTPNYIFVATGNIVLPRIQHAIFESADSFAYKEADRIASALAKAGYFNFTLFAYEGGKETEIASYRVETPEPVVSARYVAGKEPAEAKP